MAFDNQQQNGDQMKNDPFFAEMEATMQQAREAQAQMQQQVAEQQQAQEVQTHTEQKVDGPTVDPMETAETAFQLVLLIPLALTVLIGFVFVAGYKEAKFIHSLKNVLKALWETIKYIVIPNDKGLKFVDRVIVTPLMRLELFGLNQGFVKIGEIYHGYFEKGFQRKEHGINQSINPYLGHVAFVISAFQTKQYLLYAVRVLITLELFYLLATNVLVIPFGWLIAGTFGLEPSLLTKAMMVVLIVISGAMTVAYIRKIVDDAVTLMTLQQDVDTKEFRNFVLDNLAMIGRHGHNVDAVIAKEAESYTLATFFNERIESK